MAPYPNPYSLGFTPPPPPPRPKLERKAERPTLDEVEEFEERLAEWRAHHPEDYPKKESWAETEEDEFYRQYMTDPLKFKVGEDPSITHNNPRKEKK